MGSRKRKDPLATRRRVDDDGEEEDVSLEDDGSSIGTLPSDAEHEADVDDDGSEQEKSPASKRKSSRRTHVNENGGSKTVKDTEQHSSVSTSAFATASEDTVAMMNGLNINDQAGEEEAIQFGETPQESSTGAADDKTESFAERRRREHEDYKRKRDADPAFVPNRGGFFMHDSRSVASGPNNGMRPGRGRGRGGRGGLPFGPHASSLTSNAPWTHDLHETIADVDPAYPASNEDNVARSQAIPLPARPAIPPLSQTPPNRTFSRTVQVGNVHLRVLLPQMKEPIIFSAVPVHSHTRLPHHRPPLRRDKPVRISIPDNPPRYIFPATDRSFIFIPRAMRPNQQGFGRSRGRGSFTGYGNFSSRNSMFGGSIYNPSIGTSRRSSIARELGREGMASPAGSVMSRNRSIVADPTKPVVRLPPAMDGIIFGQYPPQPVHFIPSESPVVNLPQTQPANLPQRPITQSYPGQIPMHQPRPQKQITVADIESPAALNFPTPQVQQQQPFHQQVPASLNGQNYEAAATSSHSRRTSHPSQQGTPLSQIPERAIHAQSFQPTYQYPPPQGYYQPQYATPIYYYAPGQPMASAVAAPPFVPGQQYPYMVPPTPIAQAELSTQPATVAHESNGMVYYYDSSQMASTGPEDPAIYQQMAYVPPTGYVMAPRAVFYPSQ